MLRPDPPSFRCYTIIRTFAPPAPRRSATAAFAVSTAVTDRLRAKVLIMIFLPIIRFADGGIPYLDVDGKARTV